MTGSNSTYKNISVVIFMMMTMFWLTISLPFISESRIASNIESKSSACNEVMDAQQSEDAGFPQTSTSEEKGSEESANSNEEYLHHHEGGLLPGLTDCKTTMHDLAQDAYCAFHGELLVPPPNVI
jgi:hypothetical protein